MSHQHGQHSPASAFTAIYHTLCNKQTGMYLGAHMDGLLIAEDNTTNHHDVAWKVVPGHSGILLPSFFQGNQLLVDAKILMTLMRQDLRDKRMITPSFERPGFFPLARSPPLLRKHLPCASTSGLLRAVTCHKKGACTGGGDLRIFFYVLYWGIRPPIILWRPEHA